MKRARASSISRRRALVASAVSVVGLCASSLAASSPNKPFDIKVHGAAAAGLFVNSYLFVGDHSSFLIDAQLTRSDAGAVAEMVNSTGKPLEGIVITHPHPDHYLGLEVLGPAFPDAVIYAAPRAVDRIKSTAHHWPQFNNGLQPVTSGRFDLAGVSMELALLPDSESIAPLVLHMPSRRLLVAGDHALKGQHLWLAEKRADAWLENLADIRKRWTIDTVLPGHGEIGGTEILDRTEAYISGFLEVVGSGADIAAARGEMIRRFPGWRFEAALDTSLVAYLT